MSENPSKKMFNSMTNISDDLIEEAQSAIVQRKSTTWIKWALAAACFCIVLGVSFLNMPNPANAFAVKAYALGEREDGTIQLIETDLINQPDVWGGHFDGDNFYVSVGLRYEGQNIEHVDFITEEGFFAKQYIDELTIGDTVSKMYVGADNRLVMYGTEFDIVGNQITLNDETMTDDLLLFWGTPATDTSEIPEHIEIHSIATFYDGRTQELTISVDLSGVGVYSATASEEELRQHAAETDYYRNLPLEQCELVEESVETVTDVYEVKLGISTSWITIREEMEFDENGIWRGGTCGDFTADGYEVYIPVIQRDDNGVYTGMLYKVPKRLQYNRE